MVGQQALLPQHSDPKLWLVHTKPGAEREAVQCLLQKGVDLALRSTPLQIKAAFTQDHLKARPGRRISLGFWGACTSVCVQPERLRHNVRVPSCGCRCQELLHWKCCILDHAKGRHGSQTLTALEHLAFQHALGFAHLVQGYIYVEAYKEAHVKEAMRGLRIFFQSKGAQLVPLREMVDAITVNAKARAAIGTPAPRGAAARRCWAARSASLCLHSPVLAGMGLQGQSTVAGRRYQHLGQRMFSLLPICWIIGATLLLSY